MVRQLAPAGGQRRVDAVRSLALGIFRSGMTRNATIAQIPLAPGKIDIESGIHRAKIASCQRHEAATEQIARRGSSAGAAWRRRRRVIIQRDRKKLRMSC